MTIPNHEFEEASERGRKLCETGRAVAARFNSKRRRVIVELSTEMELTFPVRLAEGLAYASDRDLSAIEISAAGLGLHWPQLDVDLYVPALLQGIYGSRHWMAKALGTPDAGVLPHLLEPLKAEAEPNSAHHVSAQMIRDKAAELFGSEFAAKEWLGTEAPGLGFKCPEHVMRSLKGKDNVWNLLRRIECGVFT